MLSIRRMYIYQNKQTNKQTNGENNFCQLNLIYLKKKKNIYIYIFLVCSASTPFSSGKQASAASACNEDETVLPIAFQQGFQFHEISHA